MLNKLRKKVKIKTKATTVFKKRLEESKAGHFNVIDKLGFNPFPDDKQLLEKMDFFYQPYNNSRNINQHMEFKSEELLHRLETLYPQRYKEEIKYQIEEVYKE